MTKFGKMLILIIAAQAMSVTSAFAVVKLSSSIRAIKANLPVIEDYANKAQETVDGVVTEANKIIRLATSGELAERAKKYAEDKAGKYARSYVDEKIEQEVAKAKQKRQELKKAENKLAAATAQKDDYVAAQKDAQTEKIKQIDERLTELRAKVQSSNLSEDEHKKLVDEIADLEAQKQHILDQPINDETYQGLEDKEKEAAKEVEKLKPEADDTAVKAGLQEQAKNADLFDDETDSKANQEIYQTEIEALFLKESEETSSENMARIKKNRQRAYYDALQKAMEVAVVGTAASADLEEHVTQYTEMATDVEGNYALKNANIAIIIENAKAAARFTEALLAEIRLKTSQDMTSWNNKYHLYDYKKPVTEFDFDSYELKKNDLLKKGKEFLEQNKDKAKDLWHRI